LVGAPGLREAFANRFPGSTSVRLYRAPGRVNLIGEHTDYNGGFVLPIAIEPACYVAAAANQDGVLRVHSQNLGESRQWPLEQLARLKPAGDWGDYVAGVAQQMCRQRPAVPALNVLVHSTVPVGGGLSSSAALEVAVALALLGSRPKEPLELAQLCHRAETSFVGLPCGIMDQYVSLFARAGAALWIDCRSLASRAVPLPPGCVVMAVNSRVKHELGRSAYGERVAECALAAKALGVGSLREATIESVAGGEAVPMRRARHVVSENRRVHDFVEACTRGDPLKMGTLMVESHESLRLDYEVSCEELDWLVEAARKVPGVLGARMTGGGFGGCTVNLLRAEAEAAFVSEVSAAYLKRFGVVPEFYECRPAAAAGEIF